MSNFFNKSDLTRQDTDKIVSDTLNNCDDGELYLEAVSYTHLRAHET